MGHMRTGVHDLPVLRTFFIFFFLHMNLLSRAGHALLNELAVGGAAEGGASPAKSRIIGLIRSFRHESCTRAHGCLRGGPQL